MHLEVLHGLDLLKQLWKKKRKLVCLFVNDKQEGLFVESDRVYRCGGEKEGVEKESETGVLKHVMTFVHVTFVRSLSLYFSPSLHFSLTPYNLKNSPRSIGLTV